MPYQDPDPEDPALLVGVELPGGREEMTEMAWVFAEEFARMGYREDAVLALFRDPFYAGAHRALRALGEDTVQAIAREATDAWGAAARVRVVDAGEAAGAGRRLAVIR